MKTIEINTPQWTPPQITGTWIPIKRPLMKSASTLDDIFKPISDDSPSYSLDGIFNPISDSLPSSFPNVICKPIPDIIHQQYHFRQVQISGHSSVQSSSTFRLRKANSQSTSSGLRRLNRVTCCTLKFSLSFYSTHSHWGPQLAQGWPRID